MKLLCTADLHDRRDWYDWLLQKAPQYDAIIIAGDLLDMLGDVPRQVKALRRWVGKMKLTGASLLLCDGIHDFNSVPIPISPPSSGSSPAWDAFVTRVHRTEHWMEALIEEGALLVGGSTRVFPELEGMIVSSLLNGKWQEQQNAALMREGAALRSASPRSRWVVLHHEPPVGMLGDALFGNAGFGKWVEEFQPTVVLAGNDHRSPFVNETCCEQFGVTRVFNAGYRPGKNHPCAVELETKTMKFDWIR